ncbi:hypothetical protein F2Q68_00031132 [Brassica cretica]|uniref:Uncharacterized protein n=1 Tax=Brassica cretica TaxID=69181 RepID=A0A8S9GHF7_BRACR|nr:hypothetical protein F2Q68_00031132 [Brassica cretica]
MKSKPDLALDSSSIGGRVRSKKQRSGVGPSKSMDSSGSSLDLTVEVENLSCEVIDLAPPSVEVGEFPPVGPPSLIGVDEVANWRAKLTRSQCMKGFSNWALEIEFLRWWRRCRRHWRSPLVLHSYAITQLNGSEWRYHLHPRGGELPVQEIVKKNRKRVPDFDGRWTEKFAFMYLPGFSPVWCTAGGPLRPCRNPEVLIRRSLFGTRRFVEVVMTPMHPRLHRGTILRLPRKGYYRYLFGFRILPLGSWPLSSSYDVFYFLRKSLTGLEGASVGVMTQVPGLRCFPPRSVLIQVLFTLVLWGARCALSCTGVLSSFDSILRLAHTNSCFMSHTRFDSLWACHYGRATLVRVGQDRRSLEA